MKVPQHTIKSAVVKTTASEELQAEVEKELEQSAQAAEEGTPEPDITEFLSDENSEQL